MLSARRPNTATVCATFAVLVAFLGVALVALRPAPAHAVSVGRLQQQISVGQRRASALSSAVRAASGHIAALDSSISALQRRISSLQSDLDSKRAALIKIEVEATEARTRLAQLEAFEARGETVLARQLVNSYESDQPDLVTVVLESNGFQDLLERLDFAERVQKQDVQIVTQVRRDRRAVAAQAVRLGALEARQQALATKIIDERNALAASNSNLLKQRIAVATARGREAGRLSSVRAQIAGFQHQLAQIHAAQAAAAAAAQRQSAAAGSAPSAGTPAPGPAPSSGGFVFPLPKSAAAPPGSWSPDQGVDISAPGNTPEYAVCSGTIVLHGIGGFGPWAPVLHCDSPLDGYSYVYYGHAGPEYQLAVGTHVGAGQVMSSIGPGIVGISSGPHLEIGFCDSSGSPIGSQTAGTMLSLLQASY